MGLSDELPVYKASYDLLLEIFKFVRHFSKEFKYTVGDSLKTETMELLSLIYRANSSYEKAEIIQQARERLEMVRLMMRLMVDLKQVSLQKSAFINEKIENVSRQLSGWQKSRSRETTASGIQTGRN